MAEIDTRQLESVQAGVALFDPISDQLNRFSPDRNEEEIVIITKELATCKLQLEVKESESKQAILKYEALQKAMQELSDKYDRASLDAYIRITQLEADNSTIRSQQSEMEEECKTLRDELATVKGELDAAKASIAFLLREVELMETRTIMERESTKEALARILQLNDTVLSSAVVAIRAEEERSVFFQEVTLEFFNSDKNLEVIRRQTEMMESMEKELLAKTMEVEYLRSELKHVKELYMAPQAGCDNSDDRQVQACCETTTDDQKAEAEFTSQHSPQECFVSEIFRKDCQVVPSDDTTMKTKMSEDVVEGEGGVEVMVQVTTVPEGNSDVQETRCLVAKISGEDHACIVATEIAVSKDEDEFYTKELEPEQGNKLDGYVLVAKSSEANAVNGKLLDAARAEISNLRFSLEEAVRRAELAEEAKEALERELREEIRNKHPSRRLTTSDSEDGRRPAREKAPPALAPMPSRPRPTPSRGPRSARPGGEHSPTPRCVTLGKVLNMKYK
ncbi:uncharacterized protein LOC133914452 [Phragmites australis]|uniref:uncharacterized protein LOC133914452 n=1 Tax=Phragmites australis TaxID=29695 RepID=UPI002D76FBC8|nr:uncharacterized protein LOC133914452 [Phragmites australis]